MRAENSWAETPRKGLTEAWGGRTAQESKGEIGTGTLALAIRVCLWHVLWPPEEFPPWDNRDIVCLVGWFEDSMLIALGEKGGKELLQHKNPVGKWLITSHSSLVVPRGALHKA